MNTLKHSVIDGTNGSLSQFPLAMGYVPWQKFSTPYEPEKAFSRGTLFPELDKPFAGRRIVNDTTM